MDENIYDNISKLYTDSGYFSRYSKDIWITIIICIIVFYVVSYFYIMNHLQPIKKNWSTQRCNPAVMPFAGFINNNTTKSNFDFTKDNFEHCTQTILGDITKYSFTPLYYLMGLITTEYKELSDALASSRSMFNNIRNDVKKQGDDIYGRSLNITLPIIQTFQILKDIFGKAQATMVSGIYTLYGGYITTNSLFLYIYEATLSLLYIIISFIIACFAVGWLFPPTLIAGLSAAAFMTILLIPIIVIMTIMTEVFDAADIKTPPTVPGFCFSGETKIKMREGSKKISKIKVGEILSDGSIVTAIMKSSSRDQIFYNLNEVIVTSNHMVFHSTLGWIPVKSHPNSILLKEFKEPYIYCLNTNTKIIEINNIIFADWDEIDDDDIDKYNKKYNTTFKDDMRINIHKYLNNSIHPFSSVYLENGERIYIKDLRVNDVLSHGEIVKSIVTIDTSYMKDKFYNFFSNGVFIISGTSNLDIHLDVKDIDNIITKNSVITPKISYHIITNTGEFHVKNVIIKDYNYTL